MNVTTKLELLKKAHPFTWGHLIAIHEIAEYAIVEYNPWIVEACAMTNKIDFATTNFHCYVNNENTSRSTSSLDEALATCIALKYDSEQAGTYFMKMIGAI